MEEKDRLEAGRRVAEAKRLGTKSLDLSKLEISDLPPLGELTDLEILDCSQTNVSDLSPVAGLSNLQELNCSYALVSDLSPVARLSNLQQLNCSYTSVGDLSPLEKLSNLRGLDCSCTPVSDLSPTATLSTLQELSCYGTTVSDLSPAATLSALQKLDCSGTQVSDLSPLEKLLKLRDLDCSGAEVSDLSPLEKLSNLQQLDCSYTQVSGLLSVAMLSSLQRIDCCNTPVNDLSPLEKLSNLQELDCSGSGVSDLSPVELLSSLQKLDCSYTPVSDLSPLWRLLNLRELDCSGSKVTDLSPLEKLLNLRELDCSYTQVNDLSLVQKLSNLEILDCSGLQVSDLFFVARLCHLRGLYFYDTQVSDLSHVAKLSNLQNLNCSKTQVSDLSHVAKLSNLQNLNCSNTQVSDLSPLEKLSNLQELVCYETQTSDLSPLSELSNIQGLHCSDTQVSELSPLIELSNLRILDCSRTNVCCAPMDLISKDSLIILTLRGCRIHDVPPEVIDHHNSLSHLRSHFADLELGASVVPDIKLMVLGNGMIGKTQLCRFLRSESYDETIESTHGIWLSSHSFTPDIWLNIWDFGGQDIYHGVHTIFLKSRAVYLVLWTPRSENQSEHEIDGVAFRNHTLDYWLEIIQKLGGGESAVLIIQSQCDSVEQEERRAPYTGKYDFKFLHELHFSARTGNGSERLRAELVEAVKWMRNTFGTYKIGNVRLKIKRRLEEMREQDLKLPAYERQYRTISKEYFCALCQDLGGVSDPEALLAYLHHCGTVFYRRGYLGDAIILAQEWALDAIYTLFNRKDCWRQLHHLNGRFDRALLGSIAWRDHSPDDQRLFLSMMESCGVCFRVRSIDHDEYEYIAPDLLPSVSAVADDLAAVWHDAEHFEEAEIRVGHEHPGLVTSILSRLGSEAGISALYWKEGFCGYEKLTASRVRFDARPGTGGKGPILRLRTQGTRAKELLVRVVKWIREAAKQSDCEAIEFPAVQESPSARDFEDPEAKEEPLLRFESPPREKTTYAVSYSWVTDSAKEVDDLCAQAAARGIVILRDKDDMRLGDRISQFMQKLAAQDQVFVILSDAYLKSAFCMSELLELWRIYRREGKDFLSHVRVYTLPGTSINSALERARHAVYWIEEFNELDAVVKTHGARILGDKSFEEYKRMLDFAHHVGDILDLFADILRPKDIKELVNDAFPA
jgi:internalin A